MYFLYHYSQYSSLNMRALQHFSWKHFKSPEHEGSRRLMLWRGTDAKRSNEDSVVWTQWKARKTIDKFSFIILAWFKPPTICITSLTRTRSAARTVWTSSMVFYMTAFLCMFLNKTSFAADYNSRIHTFPRQKASPLFVLASMPHLNWAWLFDDCPRWFLCVLGESFRKAYLF